MSKLLVKHIGFALVLYCSTAQSQCPSGTDILNSITAVQKSAATFPEKIKQLLQLQSVYLKCNKQKDSVYGRLLHRLGDFYSKDGDYEKAISYTKEAVAVNSQPNGRTEKPFLANSYFNLGSFYKDLYLFEESQHYFDSCIAIARQYPDRYFILFMAVERKAYMFFQTGDYEKSTETADKGIIFARGIQDSLNEAPLLSQKAQAQDELNDIVAAEQNIKKSISILEKTTDTSGLATAYSIYAHLLNKKGDATSAIKYYQKAFNLNHVQEYWLECSKNMLDLGYLYDKDLKNGAKAISCYQQGIKMLEKENDLYQLAGLYINTGVAYWRQKKYSAALSAYQKALNSLPIQFHDTSIRANPSTEMLKLVANDYFVSTLLANKGEALLDQYKVSKNNEFLKAAIASFQVADQSVDLMRWKQLGEQSKLFWREKTKKMYENAIEACYLSNDIDKAYYFFEKSRAVLLNDKLSELGAKRFIAQADRIKEQQLRNKVTALGQQLLSTEENSASFNSTRQQLLSARDEWEAFIKSLEKNYPGYYQYKYDNVVYPLKDVKQRLRDNNQTLVEFFNADSVVYALAVSGDKDHLMRIPFKNYAAVTREFMTLCSDHAILNQNYPRYRSLAYQLYEKLFRPLNINKGRVIISPDDYFIPFDALVSDPTNSSAFLLRNYAFSYTYSMGLQMKAANTTASGGSSFLGVAPVTYRSYLQQQPLEGADQSLKNIRSYFSNASFLVNEDASRKEFLKELPTYKTVQIYSHADADSSGKEPVLYLNDSAIHINEIQSLEDFQTQMIVLSACETGVGKNAKGEGIFSLARAFTTAGIPSTVTTLWQVDNQATYKLTEAFYKYLSQGLPKDVAMQKAKLEFLDANDKTNQLPYYWAASIVLGKTNALDKESSSLSTRQLILVIGAVLAVTLLLIFVFKKR